MERTSFLQLGTVGAGGKVANASLLLRPLGAKVLPTLDSEAFEFDGVSESAGTFDCQFETRPEGKAAFVLFQSLVIIVSALRCVRTINITCTLLLAVPCLPFFSSQQFLKLLLPSPRLHASLLSLASSFAATQPQ